MKEKKKIKRGGGRKREVKLIRLSPLALAGKRRRGKKKGESCASSPARKKGRRS